ncbi:MAG: gliding motility-associated ABC transporter permease subunit GldF [Bacteroidales bacterium]|nr:gliding motility-associated ABC transporter permease subunit GldF [Bacteroidales bacterium]
MFVLFKKEIFGFLNSLIGYIVMAVFLLINGLFLWIFPMEFNVLDFGYATLDSLFMLSPFVFLFLIPAITMRSFAEEKRTGAIEMLFTKPITDFQIVMAKYWAGLTLVVIAILPTLVYFFSIYWLAYPIGNVDIGGIIGSYIGLLFLGASFTAIGIFCSAITDNQIVSFVLAVFISLFCLLGFEFIYSLALFGKIDIFIQSLGIQYHYRSISHGVIDTRDLIYFISFNALFIGGTLYVLQRRNR